MNQVFRLISVLIGVTHFIGSCLYCIAQIKSGAIFLNPFVLVITSILYLVTSIHLRAWIPAAKKLEGNENEFMPEWLFHVFSWLFLCSMTMVCCAQSLGFLWVSVELTTLMSAPLIAFHRTSESLEAMWKYLLICSVGIGLALLGTMFVTHAVILGGHSGPLEFAKISVEDIDPTWFLIGFILIFAGYGTKMGLSPFHTWLPDAHSEAPAPVSALLSGALLNCSFLAIYKFCTIIPPDLQTYCSNMMMIFGVMSVATAAIFIVRQTDYKRMLAYSSVEHMGLILILFVLSLKAEWNPINPNNLAPFTIAMACFAHVAFHSLTKMTLFLTAGNFLLAFGTRAISAVQGTGRSMRTNARLWIIGIILICGFPPSALFLTELALVFSAESSITLVSIVFILLFIVFAGMSKAMLSMTFSDHPSIRAPVELPRNLYIAPRIGITLVLIFSVLSTALFLYAMLSK